MGKLQFYLNRVTNVESVTDLAFSPFGLHFAMSGSYFGFLLEAKHKPTFSQIRSFIDAPELISTN